MGGRHARGMTRITLLSVTMAVADDGGAGSVTNYPYPETRLCKLRKSGCVLSLLVPPLLFQSLPVSV